MNIEEYISSGIIETYVLGLADKQEARQLEELCQQHTEIQAALREAQSSLEDYAQLNAVAPPTGAKEKIWAAISDKEPEIEPISKEEEPEKIKENHKTYSYISRAAVFLVLVGLPYHFYKMNQYELEISTLQREKNEILAQNQIFSAQIREVSQEIEILSNPSTRNIVLAGVEGHEDHSATVHWRTSGEIFLTASGLPPLDQEKQYQLWAIVDGKPVNAGLLEEDGSIRLQKMLAIERAEMFAITIENRGGSEQPTLDQMVVAGKVLS